MQNRLIVAVLLVVVLFLILLARVWYLQVYQFQRFETLSEDNRISLVPVPPVRGQIFDRNGKVLAENVSVYTLEVVPADVEDMQVTLDRLSQLIQITPWELKRFKESLRDRPDFESQTLKSNLTDEQVAKFAVNQQHFKGVSVRALLQRHYPYQGELAHALGYVGRISQRDLEVIDTAAYRGTRYIGKLGIEAQYEDELLGEVGYEQVQTNAHGRRIEVLERSKPIAGNDLHLHLDIDLQIVAREALGDRRGAVVAIEPATGGVLAFVSNPVYDPNLFVNGIDHKNYNRLRDDINRPLLNRALNGRYAPGSTIKGLFALAALDNGWTKNNHVFCPGWYSLKGSSHRYRCWKRSGHGSVNFHSAIVHSCDVYFYQLAHSLGIEKMHQFLTRFGLGRRTGIDLGGEPEGLVPSKEWKRRVRKTVWYPGETVIAGIGQGYMLSTPIQLAAVVATLANRGDRIQPRMVNHIVSPETGEVTQIIGEELGKAANSTASHYEQVIAAMRDVVHSTTGTARGISRDMQYEVAGKTGTAQVVGIPQGARYDEEKLEEFQRDHSLFVSFAPIDKPKIAVAVIVENGGSGSKSAAPIARTVMDRYLLGDQPEAVAVEPTARQAQ